METNNPDKQSAVITVKVPVSWANAIDAIAESDGYVNRSEYIRRLLRDLIKQSRGDSYGRPTETASNQ